MNNYNYAKDNRTDSQYQKYVENGIENQKRILKKLNKEFGLIYTTVKSSEHFTKVFTGNYEPDALIGNLETGNAFFVEVKASKSMPDFIDIKKSQIDMMEEIKAKVIYATEEKVLFIDAQTIREKGVFVEAELSKVNKDAYRFNKCEGVIVNWKTKLDLLTYKT